MKRAVEGVVNHVIGADQEYMSTSPELDYHSLEQDTRTALSTLLMSDLPP